MKWLGLTGGIGSGKTTVSNFLIEQHIPLIDADELAKYVVAAGSPGLKSVIREFGTEFLQKDGSLDRLKMGQVVFGDPQKRIILDSLLHPLIREEALKRKKEFESRNVPVAVYDIPLLFETASQGQFDAIIVVYCNERQQKERLKKRNPNLTANEINNRIQAQISLDQKMQWANFVVHNEGDQKQLKQELDRLLSWIREKS